MAGNIDLQNGVYEFDLDLEGTDPKNLILEEDHDIGESQGTRLLIVNHPAFHQGTEEVYDILNDRPLVLGIDYFYVNMSEVLAEMGKGASDGIVIANKGVSKQVRFLKYQTVGGPFSQLRSSIVEMIKLLDLDNRPVHWNQIIGKPNTFNPSPHRHQIEDLYNYKQLIMILDHIASLVLYGDEASHTSILQAVDIVNSSLSAAVSNHVNQTFRDGVHGIVMATKEQVKAMSRDDVFVTPASLKSLITEEVLARIETSLFVGMMICTATNQAVDNKIYIPMEGGNFDPVLFSELFSVYQYSFGRVGNNFVIPDMRGVVPRGWDNGRGLDPGRQIGTYQGDAIQKIVGGISSGLSIFSGIDYTGAFFATGTGIMASGPVPLTGTGLSFDSSRSSRSANETRVKSFAVRWYVRYAAKSK